MAKMNNSDLTICSVYHSSETKRFLELNFDLTKRLNPDASWKWIVADGCEGATTEGIDREKFIVVKGANSKDIPQILSNPLISKYANTYLHGLSLNNALKQAKTRFVLFLDCDFFVTRRGWIKTSVDHMAKNDLGFWGSPYHPRFFRKYRNFPCVQYMLIDLNKINIATLDFTPNYPDKPLNLLFKLKSKFLRLIWGKHRSRIAGSRDANYRVYKKYCNKVSHDIIQASFNPQADFLGPGWALKRSNLFIEKFLPEYLCFLPKRKDYFVNFNFLDQKLLYGEGAVMKKYNLEEYIWNKRLFGFHLRGVSKRFRRDQLNEDDIFINLAGILNSFT